MGNWWDKQIHRADQLASEASGSKELLTFYAQLLRAQKAIYDDLRSHKDWLPSGDLKADLARISLKDLLEVCQSHGPTSLAEEARQLSQASDAIIDEMLLTYWQSPSDIQFFPKAALQPYAHWVAESGTNIVNKENPSGQQYCPFCGGKPQVSLLQTRESSESGTRYLLCANCLSQWEFPRVTCANCEEQRPAQLCYFESAEFNHIRIEACDTCKHYIKGVDLTRFGLAAPLVDDVYSAPLDLWAREHGYSKIELNLVGV